MEIDKYLARFRSVAPPDRLRTRILRAPRSRYRDAWLLGVAALILVLLTAVNVSLENRVARLVSEDMPAEGAQSQPWVGVPVRSVMVFKRTPRVREQSWLKLRAKMEG